MGNLNKLDFDFIFYIAGVDVHFNDRLGKLKISDEGIDKRDQLVIENYFEKKILTQYLTFCGICLEILWIDQMFIQLMNCK